MSSCSWALGAWAPRDDELASDGTRLPPHLRQASSPPRPARHRRRRRPTGRRPLSGAHAARGRPSRPLRGWGAHPATSWQRLVAYTTMAHNDQDPTAINRQFIDRPLLGGLLVDCTVAQAQATRIPFCVVLRFAKTAIRAYSTYEYRSDVSSFAEISSSWPADAQSAARCHRGWR